MFKTSGDVNHTFAVWLMSESEYLSYAFLLGECIFSSLYLNSFPKVLLFNLPVISLRVSEKKGEAIMSSITPMRVPKNGPAQMPGHLVRILSPPSNVSAVYATLQRLSGS